MEQVRCTNCGSTAIVPDDSGEFCRCEACGSTFCVQRAVEFGKVQLDHTQDIRAWREYLGKQLKLQQDSVKARDYGGVKLFAQKILSVLPDDFRAQYYVALAERYEDNDTAYTEFLAHSSFDGVTPQERREVADSVCLTVEPKYLDAVKVFLARAYPQAPGAFDAILDRNIKNYIQRMRYAKVASRDVFICHRTAAPDQDIADAICTRLEERGLRCWIAPRNILAGSQNYERDILKGVENCSVFLLVSSFKSIYSEDCEMELRAAVLADKALYSYRIDDTPYDGAFEKAFASVQWLDASDDPYAHLEQLVIDIKGILAQDEKEKSELEEKRLAVREKERLQAELRRTEEQRRLDRLEKLVSSGVAATGVPVANVLSRLKRAEIEVQSENFTRAEKILDEVLDCDPENGLAWWLLMLCNFRIPSDDKLVESGKDYTSNRYYKNAERFADPDLKERLEAAALGYRNKTIRAASEVLDTAEKQLAAEDFTALAGTLASIADVFADEDNLVFRMFPDVASRFYWLKLWAKYGQTELVCVEDITREKEYKLALKYASPAQAKAYAEARETVSTNARLFLRERSKDRANDGKLVDYLVDNKNILASDTYNYYSSLLYFRKMLSQLNMSEPQLRNTTTDITTNEYFMLAQSLATEGQKRAYEDLVAALEKNRAQKERAEAEEKRRRAEEKERAERSANSKRVASTAVVASTAALEYLLFLIAAVMAVSGVWNNAPSIYAVIVMFSAILRLVNDIAIISTGFRSKGALGAWNFITSILTIIMIGTTIGGSGAFSIVLSAIGIVMSIIALAKKSDKGNK